MGRRRATCGQLAPTFAPGGALLVLERRRTSWSGCAGARDRHAVHELLLSGLLGAARDGIGPPAPSRTRRVSTSPPATSRSSTTGRRSSRSPLAPAAWLVVQHGRREHRLDVADLCAYARLLLARRVRRSRPVGGGFERWTRSIHVPTLRTARMRTTGTASDGWNTPAARRFIAHTGGMVGYTALLLTLPDEGLGWCCCQNGDGQGMRASAALRAGRRAAEPRRRGAPRRSRRRADPETRRGPRTSRACTSGTGRASSLDGARGRSRSCRPGRSRCRLQQRSARGPERCVPRAASGRSTGSRCDSAAMAKARVVELATATTWFARERFPAPFPSPIPPRGSRCRACTGATALGRALCGSCCPAQGASRLIWRRPCTGGSFGEEDEPHCPARGRVVRVGETWTPRRIRFGSSMCSTGRRRRVAEYNGGRWLIARSRPERPQGARNATRRVLPAEAESSSTGRA